MPPIHDNQSTDGLSASPRAASAISTLHLKASETQKLAKGEPDGLGFQSIAVAKDPLGFEDHGLAEPKALCLHDSGRNLGLLGIVADQDPHDDAGIEGDHGRVRAASAIAVFISSTL